MKLFVITFLVMTSAVLASESTRIALQSSPSIVHENGGVSMRLAKTEDTHGLKLGHRLGDGHAAQKKLANFHNYSYFGTIYVGTPAQEITLIFDTGSDWITIESASCHNCLGRNFRQEDSSTFEYAAEGQSKREYGSATLSGIEAKDKVCLRDETQGADRVCLEKFEWFLISKQSGINARIDGVFGLSRSVMADVGDEALDMRGVGPLLVKQLAEEHVLDANLFSLYLMNEDDVGLGPQAFGGSPKGVYSFIDFGSIQDEHMRDPSDLVWIDVFDHMFWMSYETYGVRFGESKEDAYNFDLK